MVRHDPDGLNAGSWPDPRPEAVVTPAEEFFSRSHAPIPSIDPDRWRLEVGGLVEHPASYSPRVLTETFESREITATLVCAGMRRDEFLTLGPLPGELPWGPDAASTGRWTGISLRDVLDRAGVSKAAQHVAFEGLDQVERHGRHFGFGGSVAIDKARSDEVLLATHLNGEPLSAARGFPLRLVVPGWIGARSVKWLGRITATTDPSDNYFQTNAYRIQRAANPGAPRDVSGGTAISDTPLNAVIAEPRAGQTVGAGAVSVRGWALGHGGIGIRSIEVSADDGETWVVAKPVGGGGPWTWTYWEALLELRPGPHTLVVRATDVSGRTQPARVNETWNIKGYCNNAWHRVPIVVG